MAKDVKLRPLEDGGWEVSHGGKTEKDPQKYPKVEVRRDEGPQLITFEIVGNKPVTFAPEAEAISVKAGSKPAAGDDHPQIPVWDVSHGGKRLSVYDRNDNLNADGTQKLELHYVLKFNGHGDLDPIIDNGGSTEPAPPAPPPPPAPPGEGATGTTAAPSSPGGGLLGGFDAVTFLIGLVIGLLLALAWCRWGR